MGRLVGAALRFPGLVLAFALGLLGVGLYCYTQLDVEPYRNPVAPLIEVIPQPQELSAEEVERYVTIPLESGLVGMLDVDHVRSQSLFGLSDVKCYFNWNPSYLEAQQRVINRLQFIQLPSGVQPQLSPWNAIGEIYRYVLRGPGYSLAELKTAQDWILERQFRQVPGIVDVVGFGGETRQVHVDVDPYRLKGHGLTLQQVSTAIGNANQNVGGQRLTLGEQSFNVRGLGLIRSLRDVQQVVVAGQKGIPVRVRDVAEVKDGAAPRLGIVGKDLDADVVQGIVLMRYGGDSLKTLEGLHEKVEQIRKYHLLPPGMTLEPYYDRERLVHLTTHTVIENLLVGMILVKLVLWAFLGQARAAILAAVNIPLALLAAFCGMIAAGTPANLISLGAVDFGIIVASTVIMVENIYRHLGAPGPGGVAERLRAAAAEIGAPMLFSVLIITVAFFPLFTLTGVAGVILSPMAHTYAFSIAGAVVLSMTLTPVLAARLLEVDPQAHVAEAAHEAEHAHDNAFLRWRNRTSGPLFAFSLRRRAAALLIALAPVVVAGALLRFIGTEFMPKLEEGNFWIRATLPLSISLEQSAKYVGRMRRILLGCPAEGPCELERRAFPEIRTAVSQVGRPDDGTDVSGFNNIELFAPLQPPSTWRRGLTKEKLQRELSAKLREAFPGVDFNFSQPIADNVEEAMSGVKGEHTVKVVGPDLRLNEHKAAEIARALQAVRGIEDLGVFRTLGQPDIRVIPDREAVGRYGLNVGDVMNLVQAAIGGSTGTQVYEGEKHLDLVGRLAAPYRKNLQAIRQILVPTPEGAQVPLGQMAAITEAEGPSLVYREDQRRYGPVKFSVRGRDLGSTIAEAQARAEREVHLA